MQKVTGIPMGWGVPERPDGGPHFSITRSDYHLAKMVVQHRPDLAAVQVFQEWVSADLGYVLSYRRLSWAMITEFWEAALQEAQEHHDFDPKYPPSRFDYYLHDEGVKRGTSEVIPIWEDFDPLFAAVVMEGLQTSPTSDVQSAT